MDKYYFSNIKKCDLEKPYIFISYSSRDVKRVTEDVIEFQKRGYNIWIDEVNLDKSKASWKEDALRAIEDMYCSLVVFYVSKNSLCSEACLRELQYTISENTKIYHFYSPVGFIAVDVEQIGNIVDYAQGIYMEIRNSRESKELKMKKVRVVSQFISEFFNSNNEKVRIHSKDVCNRKMDYYIDIIAAFPDDCLLEGQYEDKETDERDALKDSSNEEKMQTNEMNAQEQESKTDDLSEEMESGQENDIEESDSSEKVEVNIVNIESINSSAFVADEENSEKQLLKACEEIGVKYHIQTNEEGIIVYVPEDIEGEVTIPKGITGISDYAFNGCKKIKSIEIPEGITKIGEGVFGRCSGLKSLLLPKSIEKIGDNAFSYCIELESINIPDGVIQIGAAAFRECEKLKYVNIPNGLMNIGDEAFRECTSLEKIEIPSSVEIIGYAAFSGCENLEEIEIPSSAEGIADAAFESCRNLKKVNILEGVKEIGDAEYVSVCDQFERGGFYELEANYAEALKWYKLAAQNGNNQAQFKLGEIYHYGFDDEVEPNYMEALKWYKLAAQNGNNQAQLELGDIYHYGFDNIEKFEPNYTEALKWYRLAAMNRNSEAQYEIGNCYEEQGDDLEAMKWFRLAAQNGNEDAIIMIEGQFCIF